MGLRDFFKGVRKKDEGQNRPTTSNAPPTTITTKTTSSTTLTTQQSVSQPATQNTSTTTLPGNPPYVKRDLWDEAYEALRAENEDLIQKYEEIILEHDKQNTGPAVQQLGEFILSCTSCPPQVNPSSFQPRQNLLDVRNSYDR